MDDTKSRQSVRDESGEEVRKTIGITLANPSISKTNKARAIRFSTLEALCRELDCQPGDLLRYRAETEPSDAGDRRS